MTRVAVVYDSLGGHIYEDRDTTVKTFNVPAGLRKLDTHQHHSCASTGCELDVLAGPEQQRMTGGADEDTDTATQA